MNSLIVTPEMLALLRRARETVEICDSQGTVVGHFAPAFTQPRLGDVPLPNEPEPGKTYSLKEVYQYLLSISPDEERKAILRNRLDEMAREEECTSQ